ncbi:MAG TPA: BREX-2 system phosphatase PglZ [Actinocrinis sp.]|uniref:BREX-2 system phosphatase PglZ n=1 Tax=Actinocrinis sp. TaxID=1920516 RepID=UPI002DDD6604|nr:BREX-2 system phosphatase PglZ [Actinocrinis sp.]HEV2345496.1 BREX-2 system phosphatase PglZ [Actinocrinis sp.]
MAVGEAASVAAASAPRVSRGMLESLVRRELGRKASRLLLVYAQYASAQGPARFRVQVGETRYVVTVTACSSVLAVADAWESFQSEGERAPDGASRVLVITSTLAAQEIGLSLRAFAARMGTIAMNPAELVCEQFGARELDWRLARDGWLLDALLAAEPTEGWKAASQLAVRGSLLTRDGAVAALLAVRLGLGFVDSGGTAPDASAVLDWSRGAGPDRFAALPDAEREGITAWLAETTGQVAVIVLQLAELGRARDAVALGLLCTALDTQRGSAGASDALLLLGALFGPGGPSVTALSTFARAVEGTVQRWIAATEGGGDRAREHRTRVLDVVNRAEALAVGYPPLQTAFAASQTLPAGFSTRLESFAAALTADQRIRSAETLDRAQDAFQALAAHRLAALFADRLAVAEMALRLARWLHASADELEPATVPGWLGHHLAVLGWVDRALNTLYHGDPEPGTDAITAERVAAAYRAVHEHVRASRGLLDQRFASALSAWAASADTPSSSTGLLVEDVLAAVAVPLAAATGRPPLILVLDGMSSAVAAEFGERLTRRNVWTEVTMSVPPLSQTAAGQSQRPVRMAAAVAIPSVTTFSRTSLLSGSRRAGGQHEEKEGFAAFWRQRSGSAARLFHKREIADELAGGRLNPELTSALAGEAAVGVVLNDVDDALDKGGRGDLTQWAIEHVTHFESLLDAARSYDRPVLLVSDHGHVLDRSAATTLPWRTSSTDKNQRYRSADGEPTSVEEVLLTGPRVMDCGGALVAAVAEHVRYTSRRAGYHGGASLAEMTVPVLVFLPAGMPTPKGWTALQPWQTTPHWWNAPTAQPAAPGVPATGGTEALRTAASRRSAAPVQEEALFPLEAPVDEALGESAEATAGGQGAGETLGAQVVASGTYLSQKRFVLKMKDAEVVAAIDALVAGDRTLPASVLAQVVGRSGTSFDGFLANLERLLNIDQYPVLSRIDSGRTIRLDRDLLDEQFDLDRS